MNLRHKITIFSRQSGFTLIELAIVITIIGFFMVGLVKAYELYQLDKIQREQDNRMDEMRRALAQWIQDSKCVDGSGNERAESWCADPANSKFAHLGNEGAGPNGQDAVRFPCPADPEAAPDEANYATEVDNSGGTCDISGGVISIDGGDAYLGAFPARTVGVSPSVMIDPYGNKYTYVVSGDMVNEGALLGNAASGNLQIVDDGPGGPMNSRFALFSHGENGAGAFPREGGSRLPTNIVDTGSPDHENIDSDLEFETRQGKYMAQGSSSYYDDSFAASLADDEDEGWWHATSSSAEDITNRNPRHIGIGIDSPFNSNDLNASALDVEGMIRPGDQNAVPDSECDSDTEGAIRYNASKKEQEFCDGNDWQHIHKGHINPNLVKNSDSDSDSCGPCGSMNCCTATATATVTAQCASGQEISGGGCSKGSLHSVTRNSITCRNTSSDGADCSASTTYGGCYQWSGSTSTSTEAAAFCVDE